MKIDIASRFNDKWQHKKMIQLPTKDLIAWRKWSFIRFFMVLVGSISLMGGALAQDAAPQTDAAAMQAQSQDQQQAQQQAEAPAGVSPDVVAALEKRVKNLEQEITDLRTMIGTFASMGRGRNGAVDRRGGSAGSQFGAPGSGPRSSNMRPSSNLPWQGTGRDSVPPQQQGLTQQGRDGANFEGSQTALSPPPKRPDVREDGVTSDEMVATRPAEGSTDQRPGAVSEPLKEASVGPAPDAEGGNAQSLYNDAYSHLLRRDFPNAEKALGAFIKKHPRSRLVGNAQYWLGETFFARSKYRPAADAFLKSYRNHPDGIKAPNSLMKLAFSLARLGQKGAACKTFDELDLKYPNAPNHVKQRAGMERRRTGCN